MYLATSYVLHQKFKYNLKIIDILKMERKRGGDINEFQPIYLIFLSFLSGLYIRPTNSFIKDGNLEYYPADESKPDKFVPSLSGYAGGNWFDEERKLLYVVVKGSEPYKIVTVPIIKVGFFI